MVMCAKLTHALSGVTNQQIEYYNFKWAGKTYSLQMPPIFWLVLRLARPITLINGSGQSRRYISLFMTSMGAVWVPLEPGQGTAPGMTASHFQWFHETVVCANIRTDEIRDVACEWNQYNQDNEITPPVPHEINGSCNDDIDTANQRRVLEYYAELHETAFGANRRNRNIWWYSAVRYYKHPHEWVLDNARVQRQQQSFTAVPAASTHDTTHQDTTQDSRPASTGVAARSATPAAQCTKMRHNRIGGPQWRISAHPTHSMIAHMLWWYCLPHSPLWWYCLPPSSLWWYYLPHSSPWWYYLPHGPPWWYYLPHGPL